MRRLRDRFSPWLYAGDTFHCPVCERSFRKFRSAGRGEAKRANAVCPYCISRERDRLVFLFLRQEQSRCFPPATRLLHIAPEPSFEKRFRKLATGGYVTADLIRKDVDENFDVTDIPHGDASFDAVFCSHVLQDVPDDRKAIEEFFRILKPGGWAILNVPVGAGLTTEHRDGPKHVRAGSDRRPDEHVRTYGTDYQKRMEGAGFEVEVVGVDDLLSPDEQRRMAVDRPQTGSVYFGVKPLLNPAIAP